MAVILWSPAIPARPRCPHPRLQRLLADAVPDGLGFEPSTLRPWASANFVGARHVFPCRIPAEDTALTADMLAHRLSAIEWSLPGHIVADVAVEPANEPGQMRIEILTVED